MRKKKHYVKPQAMAVIVCTESLLTQGSGLNVDIDGNKDSFKPTEGNPDEIDAGKNTDLWIDEDE